MGAYSPAPVVTPALHARIMREIILPTVDGMAADGMPYTGFLYAGVMIDADGTPKRARVQLPHGRPGDAADHGAAQVRPRRPARARGRRHARHGRGRMGPARRARRGARRRGLSRRAAQGRGHRRPRPHHREPRIRTCTSSTPAPRWSDGKRRGERRPRAVRDRARRLGASRRSAPPTPRSPSIRFDGMQYRTDIGHRAIARKACAAAGAPVTAPRGCAGCAPCSSDDQPMNVTAVRATSRPAGAHRRRPRGDRRRHASGATSGRGPRAAAASRA